LYIRRPQNRQLFFLYREMAPRCITGSREELPLQSTKPHIHVFIGCSGETGTPEHGVITAPQLDPGERGIVPVEDNAIVMLPEVPTAKDQEHQKGPFQDPTAAGRVT
jgi:hypothetical protein